MNQNNLTFQLPGRNESTTSSICLAENSTLKSVFYIINR